MIAIWRLRDLAHRARLGLVRRFERRISVRAEDAFATHLVPVRRSGKGSAQPCSGLRGVGEHGSNFGSRPDPATSAPTANSATCLPCLANGDRRDRPAREVPGSYRSACRLGTAPSGSADPTVAGDSDRDQRMPRIASIAASRAAQNHVQRSRRHVLLITGLLEQSVNTKGWRRNANDCPAPFQGPLPMAQAFLRIVRCHRLREHR